MVKFSFVIGICYIAVGMNTLNQVHSHSYMLHPRGDFSSFSQAHCRVGGPEHAPNDECPGPCIDDDSWQYNKTAPVHKFKRNETVTVVWPRNNHRGGFVRFSMVPRAHRMNKAAHDKLAFRYSCFEADQIPCNEDHCGTDVWLYRTDIQIPTSFADGEYVLSWAWFGGLTRDKSFFGDYYSCAHVKLSGGPMSQTYQPLFIPGKKTVYEAECRSSVDRLGICAREPCSGLGEKRMKPLPFRRGQAAKLSYETPSPKVHENANEPVQHSPVILGLQMVNCRTREVITNEFSRTIDICRHEEEFITFEALTDGNVSSVSFYINDNFIRTEGAEPYLAWGDKFDVFRPWPHPILGEYFNITVVAVGKKGKTDEETFSMKLNLSPVPCYNPDIPHRFN